MGPIDPQHTQTYARYYSKTHPWPKVLAISPSHPGCHPDWGSVSTTIKGDLPIVEAWPKLESAVIAAVIERPDLHFDRRCVYPLSLGGGSGEQGPLDRRPS